MTLDLILEKQGGSVQVDTNPFLPLLRIQEPVKLDDKKPMLFGVWLPFPIGLEETLARQLSAKQWAQLSPTMEPLPRISVQTPGSSDSQTPQTSRLQAPDSTDLQTRCDANRHTITASDFAFYMVCSAEWVKTNCFELNSITLEARERTMPQLNAALSLTKKVHFCACSSVGEALLLARSFLGYYSGASGNTKASLKQRFGGAVAHWPYILENMILSRFRIF